MTAPDLLKAQMPVVRQVEKNLSSYGYTRKDMNWWKAYNIELGYYHRFGYTPSEEDQ